MLGVGVFSVRSRCVQCQEQVCLVLGLGVFSVRSACVQCQEQVCLVLGLGVFSVRSACVQCQECVCLMLGVGVFSVRSECVQSQDQVFYRKTIEELNILFYSSYYCLRIELNVRIIILLTKYSALYIIKPIYVNDWLTFLPLRVMAHRLVNLSSSSCDGTQIKYALTKMRVRLSCLIHCAVLLLNCAGNYPVFVHVTYL